MSHSKYSVIETNKNTWAVILPMQPRTYHTGRISMPTWLPAGMTHAGIFNTLDEAMQRMATLRESEGISL